MNFIAAVYCAELQQQQQQQQQLLKISLLAAVLRWDPLQLKKFEIHCKLHGTNVNVSLEPFGELPNEKDMCSFYFH